MIETVLSTCLSLACVGLPSGPRGDGVQAPTTQNAEVPLGQKIKNDEAEILRLTNEAKYPEALAKATALLPNTKPEYDSSNIATAHSSCLKFSSFVKIYAMASKCADNAGQWEKALEYIKTARDLAKENQEKTSAKLTEAVEYYKKYSQEAKDLLEKSEPRHKVLRELKNPSISELNELDVCQGYVNSQNEGDKWSKIFQYDIDLTKYDANLHSNMIEYLEAKIKIQDEEINNYKGGRGDKAKWVEAVAVSPTYINSFKTKETKLAFLYRLNYLDPNNKKIEKSINTLLGNGVEEPKAAKTPKEKKSRS